MLTAVLTDNRSASKHPTYFCLENIVWFKKKKKKLLMELLSIELDKKSSHSFIHSFML